MAFARTCIRKFLAEVRKGLRAAGALASLRKSWRKRRVNRSARQKFAAREGKAINLQEIWNAI